VKAIDKSFLDKTENGMVKGPFTKDSILKQAFESEIRILQRLSKFNSHFITLYEIFEGDLTYYLVLDLMQGHTLSEEFDILKVSSQTLPNILQKRGTINNLTL
jgi:serine/threonine protein kinase